MKNEYYVIIPSTIGDVESGFKMYNGTKKIVCKADSIDDVNKLYPDAIIITEKLLRDKIIL